MQRENEDVSAMVRVLVGVEMLRCNRNPRQMEFTVPSLSSVSVPFCLCLPATTLVPHQSGEAVFRVANDTGWHLLK